MALLESVPNVSEGRDPRTIARIAAAAESVAGVRLLHRTSDPDHHRTVLTLAGEAAPLVDALLNLAEATYATVDLREHQGVHPRVGALDVVPFIPLPSPGASATMDDAIAAAERFGRELARRFAVPVFLYEKAARVAERSPLPAVRAGGLEGLAARIGTPGWIPEFGPTVLHPSAGAAVVGARKILVAYNVVLDTEDVRVARGIARALRATSEGGLPAVRAIGVPLARLGRAQVSLNLLDYEVTSMSAAFERLRMEAEERGVEPIASELVGLAPRAALPNDPAAILLPDPREQVLETRLAAAGFVVGN